MACFVKTAVVLAHARTHNHRRLLLRRTAATRSSQISGCEYGSRLKAGTTAVVVAPVRISPLALEAGRSPIWLSPRLAQMLQRILGTQRHARGLVVEIDELRQQRQQRLAVGRLERRQHAGLGT